MKKLEQALYWHSRGSACIPCRPGTKIPCVPWKQWQTQLPSIGQLENWFTRTDNNIALLTGKIAVLDFDSLPLYAKWTALKPQYAKSYTIKTPRPGRHVYFSLAEQLSSRLKFVTGLDIKGYGGYVLIPPSISKNKLYRLREDAEILALDSIFDAVPETWLQAKREVEPRINESGGNDSPYSIAELRERLDIHAVISRYTTLVSSSDDGRWYMGICPVHDDNGPSLRVDIAHQKCYCFSDKCELHNAGGNDAIDFYAKLHQITLQRALFELSVYANMSILV